MGAKEWPLSKQWYVGHDCDRCKRAATNGVFNEPDEVRHRRDDPKNHLWPQKAMATREAIGDGR